MIMKLWVKVGGPSGIVICGWHLYPWETFVFKFQEYSPFLHLQIGSRQPVNSSQFSNGTKTSRFENACPLSLQFSLLFSLSSCLSILPISLSLFFFFFFSWSDPLVVQTIQVIPEDGPTVCAWCWLMSYWPCVCSWERPRR